MGEGCLVPRQFDFTSFLVPSEASKPGMGAGVVLRGATPSSSGARAWRGAAETICQRVAESDGGPGGHGR